MECTFCDCAFIYELYDIQTDINAGKHERLDLFIFGPKFTPYSKNYQRTHRNTPVDTELLKYI